MVRVVLVVGHGSVDRSKNIEDYGTENTRLGITEHEYCLDVCMEVFKREKLNNVDLVIKKRNESYGELDEEINELNPHFIVSVHANAYNGVVQGTEALYYHRSSKSKKLAKIMQQKMVEHIGVNDRNIEGIRKGQRGYPLLKHTKAPCTILEGVFLDSLEHKDQYKEEYAKAILEGIEMFVGMEY